LKELAEQGGLRGNIFEFVPTENGMLWREEVEDDEVVHIVTVTEFEGIYDFAPVMRPAYPDTNNSISLSKRTLDSFEEFKAQKEQSKQEEEKTDTPQKRLKFLVK